ncbi:MAG: response regulator [Elusimicrobia bacterium]|nr:response regulator [Elusimicrobiota bacterium]
MAGKARILVVDDEAQVRLMLSKLLTLHGYTVDTVNDGAQAIDQLQKNRYELMILDRYMPVMDGLTAASIIRSSPKFEAVKILMLTGDSVTKDVDDSFDAGIDGYIVKPFVVKNLLEKVAHILLK